MVFLWDAYDISIEFLCNFYGVSMIISKRFPRDAYGNSTSSTAQGGGGSFKNRKPIGEVGCCESGMAERIH